MKLALITSGLFLASYLLVNGGLGPHPFTLVVPLAVAMGGSVAVRWLMRRGQSAPGRKAAPEEPHPPDPQPGGPRPPMPPPRSGNKARKLF